MTGTLYGLGIGPGDPDLITVKALKRLQATTVLAYPVLEDGDSLARAIMTSRLKNSVRIWTPDRMLLSSVREILSFMAPSCIFLAVLRRNFRWRSFPGYHP